VAARGAAVALDRYVPTVRLGRSGYQFALVDVAADGAS
jgi:hypothetical protein